MTAFTPTYGNKVKLITSFDTKKAIISKTHIHYFVGKVNISNEPKLNNMKDWEIERHLRVGKWEIGKNLSKNYKVRELLK